MPYIEKRVKAGRTLEIYKYYSRRCKGKPSVCRESNQNPTPEAMKLLNQRRAEERLRWKINTNFKSGDYYITLTYKRENRKTPIEAKKELQKFLRRLRRLYKKHGAEVKYIGVTEYENRAIHHHMILNNEVLIEEIDKLWDFGFIQIKLLDDTGDYSKLASYLIKETSKTFKTERSATGVRYSCSRNLKEPTITENIISANSWRDIPRPMKNYYISGEVETGYHEVTGYGFQHYTMIRLN